VNFCFINEAVLVPQYDDEKDADAIQLLQQQLPMKKVIGINALALIEQFGSLHCATLHLPKGSL
jgi:agmatine deiminase